MNIKLYFAVLFLLPPYMLIADIPVIHIIPPIVSPDHCDDTHPCDRPVRKNCFKLEAEIKDNKLIMHNYGAGACGWALSFGLVRESIAQFESLLYAHPEFNNKSIRIVGAGVMGLLTAVLLHEKGYAVTICAKELHDIPSYNAGGMFCPIGLELNPEHQSLMDTLGACSFKELDSIAQGTHHIFKNGVRYLPLYASHDLDLGLDPYIARGLIAQPQEVVIDFDNGKNYAMQHYNVLFIETNILMDHMHHILEQSAITIEKRTICSFNEINESIIFNCSGLGARELNSDSEMMAVQGHILYLKNQPESKALDYMIYSKFKTVDEHGEEKAEYIYYAPKRSGIIGGTFIKGGSIRKSQHEVEKLVQRAQVFFGNRF